MQGLALALALGSVLGALGVALAQDAPHRARHQPVVPFAPTIQRVRATRGVGAYKIYRFRVPLAQVQLGYVDLGMTPRLDTALDHEHAALVVNAGFFGPENEAQGLTVADGQTLAPFVRSFSGLLTVTGGRGVLHDAEALDARRAGRLATEFAIQAKPRLVVARRVNIHSETHQHANRTALCLRSRGRLLEIIVTQGEANTTSDGPTLLELARRLAQLGCVDALNLDGGPSSGVAWRDRGGAHFVRPRGPLRLGLVVRPAAPHRSDVRRAPGNARRRR